MFVPEARALARALSPLRGIGPVGGKAADFVRQLSRRFGRYAHKKDPQVVIDAFEQFTDADNDDRDERCLAVGFCREGNVVLFKHAALESYLKLKRASIDNMFRALGYESHRDIRRDEVIPHMLPSLAGHPDARNWSVRVRKPMRTVADPAEITSPSDDGWCEPAISLSRHPSASPTVTADAVQIAEPAHDVWPDLAPGSAHHPCSIASLLSRPVPPFHCVA
jgi:hypothetical protein